MFDPTYSGQYDPRTGIGRPGAMPVSTPWQSLPGQGNAGGQGMYAPPGFMGQGGVDANGFPLGYGPTAGATGPAVPGQNVGGQNNYVPPPAYGPTPAQPSPQHPFSGPGAAPPSTYHAPGVNPPVNVQHAPPPPTALQSGAGVGTGSYTQQHPITGGVNPAGYQSGPGHLIGGGSPGPIAPSGGIGNGYQPPTGGGVNVGGGQYTNGFVNNPSGGSQTLVGTQGSYTPPSPVAYGLPSPPSIQALGRPASPAAPAYNQHDTPFNYQGAAAGYGSPGGTPAPRAPAQYTPPGMGIQRPPAALANAQQPTQPMSGGYRPPTTSAYRS